MMEFLEYFEMTLTEFNQNWLIRFYPNSQDRKKHTLISLSKLVQTIEDIELLKRLFDRARNNTNSNYTANKLRRGSEIIFIYR